MNEIIVLKAIVISFISFIFFKFQGLVFAEDYYSNSEKCYQNPLIPSLSDMNLCVGLVASKKDINWSLPRKILFLNNDSIAIVTAMGSWNKNEGQVWKLNFRNGLLVSSDLLFNKTDRTHGLRQGFDGWIYYADSTEIYRFKLNDPTNTRQLVIFNLPDIYKNQNGVVSSSNHPLKEFIFLKNGDMIVSVGAPSNDCSEEFKLSRACYQRVQQAENAADEYGTPDELNVLDPNLLANTARSPLILFPAHVAPLDILYYQGEMFPELNKSILVSWHGHRPSGSKIAIYKTDSQLQPLSDYSNTQPHLDPLQLLTLNWSNPISNGHPKGRPVGLDVDEQGAIYVVDDQNHTLLVVAKKDFSLSVDADLNSHNNKNSNTPIILKDFMSENKIQKWLGSN